MPRVLSGTPRRAALLTLVAGLAAFAVIALIALSQGGAGGLDRAVNEAVAAHRTASLTDFFTGYTGFGQWFVIVAAGVAVIAVLSATSRPRAAVFLAVAIGIALLLSPLFKVLFSRDRPPLENAALQVNGYAFPSGHSLSSATLALAIVVVAWPTRWRWPASALVVTFAALMGLSRLYLGVHWLTDVLGAWALAVGVVAAAALLVPPFVRTPAGETGRSGEASSPEAPA
jgi:membrane-associated phospholipid phosphatase